MIWHGVRMGLVILLLLTAAAKFSDVASILGSGGLLASPIRLSMTIGFEVFAALLIGFAPPRFAYRFALLVFSTLCAIASWAWWTQTDCGCFGANTGKGVPLLVDVTAIALLLACGRNRKNAGETDRRAFRWGLFPPLTIALLAGFLASGAAHSRIEQVSSAVEIPAWFGENLVGMPFPLLHDRRCIAAIPERGDALVVMLRPDCEHCRELSQDWVYRSASLPDDLVVMGVSVASGRWTFMPREVSAIPLGLEAEFAMIWDDSEEPFIAAPTLIAIRDRTVIGVSSGDDATHLLEHKNWLKRLFGGRHD